VARNRGVEDAKGEWVAFLDADDLWLPDKLSAQLRAATPDVVGVCCATYVTSRFPLDPARAEVWAPSAASLCPEKLFGQEFTLHVSSLMVRRSVPVRFPTWTRYSEDVVYQLELLREGAIAIVDQPLAIYRVHPESQVRTTLDAACRFHASLSRWVSDNRTGLGEPTADRYLRILAGRLLQGARGAVYKRHWDQLAAIQKYVGAHPDVSTADQILRMPRYPRWVYRLRDRLRR
jgi:hypothetical protein